MKTQKYYQFDKNGIYIGCVDLANTAPMPANSTLEVPLTEVGRSALRAGKWVVIEDVPQGE